jgi:photosystem II stability/assembly factor-like uncharacterized protein
MNPPPTNRSCRLLRAWAVLAGFCLVLACRIEAQAQVKFFYTDWTVVPGCVYSTGPAGEQVFYRAAAGRIYNAVVGPDGCLYYSDANQNNLIRAVGNQVTVVYTHTTYLRDIAFDPQGRLYFSESAGAFADGRIYRLNNGVAELFFTVSLTSVDGFWAGHFAFAPDGTLHLSTGNRSGAHIYRVTAGIPSSIYTAPSESIAGFDFDSLGNIYYADWFHRIYQVTPGGVRSIVLDNGGRRFADVNVVTRSVALGPEAGRVNSVAIHPVNSNILYAGTASGGVFRSHDAGQTWFWRGLGIADPRIGEMVVFPPDPTKVLAATPAGVFLSTDEGSTFHQVLVSTQPLPQPGSLSTTILEKDKNPIRYNAGDSALYAAPFCSGLFKSTDGGSTWAQIYGASLPVPDKCVTSIDFSPADGGTVWITTPPGVKKKAGGGAWAATAAEINDADPVVLKIAPSSTNRVYVAASKFGAPPYHPNLWRRDTALGLFSRTTLAPPWADWFGMTTVAVHPTNADVVYVGNVSLYVSTDAGSTWSSAIAGCHSSLICGVDYRGLTFDATGNQLYAAHDQGIFRYNATSGDFVAVEDGLVNTQFYDLDVGPAGTVYGGTQDTGGYRKTGLTDWAGIDGQGSGDLLDVLADPTNDMHVFIRTNTESVLHSADAGAHSTPSAFVPVPGFWNHQLAYDPASTTVFAGTWFSGVYKSIDDGATFSAANTGIEHLTVRALALQPGSNLVAYASSFSDGLYKTTNGGTSWQRLMSFPEPGALVITITPAGDRVYAGTAMGVYRSTDGGSTWTAASTGLPSTAIVSALVVDPVCPCLLYAGLGFYDGFNLTGGGVYQSSDGGNSWSGLSPPSDAATPITSIRISPLDRSRLYAATFGAGIRVLFRNIPGGCACP